MNLLTLSIAYIRDRALNTALNLLLLALGVATIVVLMLFSDQFKNRLKQDARGIHLVIGAKGSRLELTLNSLYFETEPPESMLAECEARLEGRVALEEVQRRFPNFEIAWEKLVRVHSINVRGFASMPIEFSP